MAKDKKFKNLFDRTDEKMGDNQTIDLKKSDIDYKDSEKVSVPAKSSTEKKELKTKKHSVYLKPSENEAFLNTFKPFEKVSDRIRLLILEDIKKRKER